VEPEDYTNENNLPVVFILEDVRSGNNVGAFFRTGDAFCIAGVELCGITCHPPHRDILKTALGASDHIPWRGHTNAEEAIAVLRSEGYKIAVVEQHVRSVSLSEWTPLKGERWALVFGNEVRGVQPATCDSADVILEIPQLGVKKSMNVSVCAGIVLWHTASLLSA
jgi:23S rRNA (guanosine2251-2'-O)-methyltransferase